MAKTDPYKTLDIQHTQGELNSSPSLSHAVIGTGGSASLIKREVKELQELDAALRLIKLSQRYAANIAYGKPRKGHPEGTVGEHIKELYKNLAVVVDYSGMGGTPLSEPSVKKLEILIEVHDTFKGEAQKRVPITDPASHASIAKDFLASIYPDKNLLDMVQFHDLPYSLYLQTKRFGDFNVSRFEELLRLIPDIELFAIFQIIDNTTKGKVKPGEAGPVDWFLSELKKREIRAAVDLFAIRKAVEDSLK